MNAIRVVDGALVWGPATAPVLRSGCVRIQVAATAVNRADLLQRTGHYPPPPGASDVLGLECSGLVIEVAPDVTRVAVGARVCALLAGGGYAEHVVCPETAVLPVGALDLIDAAGLPEVLATVWHVLRDVAQARPGERVVWHAGGSGVGTAGVQASVALGLRPFVVVGTAEKLDRCLALGAEAGAVRASTSWEAAVRSWAPDGVDVIVDPVGAATLAADQRVLTTDGRIVVIGLLSGREAPIDLGRLLVKRQSVLGTTLRSRSDDDKARIVAGVAADFWPAVQAGRIRPVLDRRLPIAEAEAAHACVASNQTFGKVVLVVDESLR